MQEGASVVVAREGLCTALQKPDAEVQPLAQNGGTRRSGCATGDSDELSGQRRACQNNFSR